MIILPIGLPMTIFTVCLLWNLYSTVKTVRQQKQNRERVARINASRAKRGALPVDRHEMVWFESDCK